MSSQIRHILPLICSNILCFHTLVGWGFSVPVLQYTNNFSEFASFLSFIFKNTCTTLPNLFFISDSDLIVYLTPPNVWPFKDSVDYTVNGWVIPGFSGTFSPQNGKMIDIVLSFEFLDMSSVSFADLLNHTWKKNKDLNYLLSKIVTSLCVVIKQHVIPPTSFADIRVTGPEWMYCCCRWNRNLYYSSNNLDLNCTYSQIYYTG